MPFLLEGDSSKKQPDMINAFEKQSYFRQVALFVKYTQDRDIMSEWLVP